MDILAFLRNGLSLKANGSFLNAKDLQSIWASRYRPKAFESLQKIFDQSKIAGLLPYVAYDETTQIFKCDTHYAFMLEVVPQVGASDETAKIFEGIFTLCPVGSAIQIQTFTDNNVTEYMDSYIRLREENRHLNPEMASNFISLATRRADFFLKGSVTGLRKKPPVFVKNIRCHISFCFPIDGKSSRQLDDILNIMGSIRSTLDSCLLPSKICTAEDLIYLTKRLINLSKINDTGIYNESNYDHGKMLRDQIVDPDTHVTVSDSELFFHHDLLAEGSPGMSARYLGVRSLPEKTHISAVRGMLGDYFQDNLQYSCPCVISLTVSLLDFDKFKGYAQMKHARATTNASSPMAKFLPEMQEQKADWDYVIQKIGQGSMAVSMFQQIALFSPPDAMDAAEQAAKSLWRARGFDVVNERFIQIKGFLTTLPMTMSKELLDDIKRLGVLSTKLTENVVALSPVVSEWRGTANPVMMFVGRLGQLMQLDFFENTAGNYNVAIAGVSGSGKSVLLNEIALSYLGAGTKVWIIDIGRSYEKLCLNLGGNFVAFTPNNSICINPFTSVVDFAEELEMLKPLLGQMISPSRPLDDYERSKLEQAIRSVWLKTGQQSCISDVSNKLKEMASATAQIDIRLMDMGDKLYPFTKNGQYGQYFEGPANVDFGSQMLTVLELEELKSKKDLQSVVLLFMLFRISQEMYLQRNSRKIVIIDEAWDLMGGGSTAEFIETGYRRARKYNGSFMTATQSWDDYYKNSAAQAALQNSDWTLMLRQKPESVDAMIKNNRISANDEYTRHLMLSIRTEQGSYSEVFINSQMGRGVGRLFVDPYALLLFSSKAQDYQDIKRLTEEGLSVSEAIERLLSERGHSTALTKDFDFKVRGRKSSAAVFF